MEKLSPETRDLAQSQIERLRELFPECVTESENGLAVDFDALKQTLSPQTVEGPQERYRLDWSGKRAAVAMANQPTDKTLRPARDESVDFDKTQNLFIEGDNLEALKLIQETYLGQVKMIYIDPPYNTGNDFIYRDDFKQVRKDFEVGSRLRDEDGNRLVANLEISGRFHSDWLSMMYSRIRIARNLLRDDGIIFISIDDELSNLKKITDEIFGERNFIDIFSWQKTTTPPNLSKKTKKSCEYILAYQAKESGPLIGLVKESRSANGLMNQTNPEGELEFPAMITATKLPNGVYSAGKYGTSSYDISLLEDTEVKDGKFILPVKLRGKFKWSQSYLNKSIEDGVKVLIQSKAFSPSYEKEEYEPEKPWNLINKNFGVGTNENAGNEIDALFHKNFSEKLYPKPVSLLQYLIKTNVMKDDLVLDFFAGSATTAHAVMQLNAEDGGNRRFVMVQLSEDCPKDLEAAKAGYETIADISKERIRRAGQKILEGECHEDWNEDIGFRVLKVDESNLNAVRQTPDATSQESLLAAVENIKPDRSEEDLLFDVMLRWGVDLAAPIERQKIDGKTVFRVNENDLVACFDRSITEDFVNKLTELKPLRTVFRDDAFASDDIKINTVQIFKQASPVTEVRSI